MTRTISAAALFVALSTAVASAQAPAPATAPAAAPAAKGAAKPRTAQSLECSKKANEGNMHGKPRQAFMRKCKAGKA